MDPLAFGSIGRNEHFPVPRNPAALDRRPGGSSSGSASAVAGGEADFALGTDSACSVRLPASLCGIYGMRQTFGRVSVEETVALSPTLDTVGWLAWDAEVMSRVGEVLLDAPVEQPPLERVRLPTDAWKLARPEIVRAIEPWLEQVASCVGPIERMDIGEPEGAMSMGRFLLTSSILQSQEVWQCHGEWIETAKPDSLVLTRDNLRFGADSTPKQVRDARARIDVPGAQSASCIE